MAILVNRYARKDYKRRSKNQRNNPIWLLQENFEGCEHRSEVTTFYTNLLRLVLPPSPRRAQASPPHSFAPTYRSSSSRRFRLSLPNGNFSVVLASACRQTTPWLA